MDEDKDQTNAEETISAQKYCFFYRLKKLLFTQKSTEEPTAEQSTEEHPTEEQLTRWKAAFKEMADVNGFITKTDLEVYFQKDNKNPKESDINTLVGCLDAVDIDGDGKINEEEFIKIQQEASKMNFYNSDIKAELIQALAAFDENNDGTISKDELKKILEDYDDKQLDEVIQYADINNDGSLSIQELAEFLTKTL